MRSEKLEKVVTVDFEKHPAQKAWTRSQAVSTQGSRQVCISCVPKSGTRKRGVEFKGGSLRDCFGGFDKFGGSGEHPTPLFACPTKYSTMRQPLRF